jgi:hypothetical protein
MEISPTVTPWYRVFLEQLTLISTVKKSLVSKSYYPRD